VADSGLVTFLDQGVKFKANRTDTTAIQLLSAATVAASFTLRLPIALPTSTQALTVSATGQMAYSALSTGSVTSVDVVTPSDFTPTGGPITTAGTITLSRNSQAQNRFLASPTSAAGVPVYRSIDPLDLPTLNAIRIPTAAVNFNGQVLSAIGTPVAATDAANKSYVDTAIVGSTKYKGTANASLATPALATGTSVFATGDMYRVITGGSAFGFVANLGDFAIYNGTAWDKIDNTDPGVTGTANRITVTPTGDTSYAIDIASNYVASIANGGTGATTAPAARTALGTSGIERQSFTNANLVAGILTASHGLGVQFLAAATVYDGANKRIFTLDDITCSAVGTVVLDLSSFGAIVGTWNLVLVG
jgi:hypothetical protein